MAAKSTPNQLGAPATTTAQGPDCERVNTILDQLIVGNEPSVEDEDYFVNHAEDCSPCFDSLDKQRIFVDFVNQYVGRKGVPSELSSKIMARVQAEKA
ncbi:hypothetical protein F0P96_07680 [Hymenobacter busanensis]|uniref:Uncharacterized protein n=1 Tax=Hymenobacter busanensis TaxID=2607656 RepID=A0A7L5A0S9_9BACT|nr:hypothetical protein [Hymenobacter busanensis]KAA9338692.1 hypothetical protein F0P96_07680 [Hymenobacter busanensis]QHJ08877.1 hypothetical protein GUY19_16920 [Hymenobacter busanensis]